MKRFAIILSLCGLIFSFFGCKQAKEGPFTFTNKTSQTVNVIITQDKTVAKTLEAGKGYTGEDYFTPKIAFVKGIDSDEDKKIIDNRFTATSINGFDYIFSEVTPSNITINLNVSDDFTSTYTGYAQWYVKEVNEKLGEYSNKSKVLFSEFRESKTQQEVNSSVFSTSSETATATTELDKSITDKKLYTDKPDFRIYSPKTVDGKTEEEDITEFFSVILNKSEVLPKENSTESATENTSDTTAQTQPSVQWNLEIIYPKINQIQ